MEVTLLVVTLLSIALAIAMGILTWRLLQEERLRSEARVAALEQGLAETLQDAFVTQSAASSSASSVSPATSTSSAASAMPRVAPSPAASVSPAAARAADAVPSDLFARDDTDWLAHFPASTMEAAAAAKNGSAHFKRDPFAANDVSRAAAPPPIERRAIAAGDEASADMAAAARIDDVSISRIATSVDEDENETAAAAAAVADAGASRFAADDVAAETVVNTNGGLFGRADADDNHVGWPRHVLAVAAVAAVMIGAVIAFWTIGRLMEPAASKAGTVAARAGAAGVVGVNGAAGALELMSLHQEMQDGTLKISGLVRNPRGGVPQEKLTAVVFFFDGQGGFLSSTRAPLDYRALAPGEESPFQLSAPAPAGVARYRVSFRRDEGAVVPHVDRRQQTQEASRS